MFAGAAGEPKPLSQARCGASFLHCLGVAQQYKFLRRHVKVDDGGYVVHEGS